MTSDVSRVAEITNRKQPRTPSITHLLVLVAMLTVVRAAHGGQAQQTPPPNPDTGIAVPVISAVAPKDVPVQLDSARVVTVDGALLWKAS
jgi:hypothetical protein